MIEPRRHPRAGDVARHYDELDWIYRDVWGEHVHHGLWLDGREDPATAAEQLTDHVAMRAGVSAGSAVCDAGCGYGATARRLAELHRATVTGITISAAQHRYARRSCGAGGPTFLLGDWLDNRLPDAAFDAWIAIESTEHMRDKQRCFDEAYRVLRPAGRLVVCAWLSADDPPPWQRRHLLRAICREGRLPGLGSAADYERLLTGAGFDVTLFEDLTERIKATWSICIARTLARLRSDRRYRRYLLSRGSRNRSFALTLPRIWLAYETGAMRYGLLAATKRRSGHL